MQCVWDLGGLFFYNANAVRDYPNSTFKGFCFTFKRLWDVFSSLYVVVLNGSTIICALSQMLAVVFHHVTRFYIADLKLTVDEQCSCVSQSRWMCQTVHLSVWKYDEHYNSYLTYWENCLMHGNLSFLFNSWSNQH